MKLDTFCSQDGACVSPGNNTLLPSRLFVW